jgi:hypothetical protein
MVMVKPVDVNLHRDDAAPKILDVLIFRFIGKLWPVLLHINIIIHNRFKNIRM